MLMYRAFKLWIFFLRWQHPRKVKQLFFHELNKNIDGFCLIIRLMVDHEHEWAQVLGKRDTCQIYLLNLMHNCICFLKS
jgi:hypothetical protein